MSIDSIRWNKLAPYVSDKRRSFEELCYQLVRLEVAEKGLLTRIEGSGGDGGVEFYLTLPNGDEWGWQAKFFYPDQRIDDGRKTQIKRSLQTACRTRPKLVRWTLVTPGNLTQEEMEWFRGTLASSINNGHRVVPEGRTVELVSHGESELLAALASPPAAGIRAYFFGEVELSLQWFRQKHEPTLAMVKRKFIPTLHAVTGIDADIEHLLAEERLTRRVEALGGSFREALETFDKTSARAGPSDLLAPLAERFAATAAIAQECLAAFREAGAVISMAEERLRARLWRIGRDATVPELMSVLDRLIEALREFDDANEERRSSERGGAESTEREYHDLRHKSWQLESSATTCARTAEEIRELLARLRLSELHLLGSAGEGKTHIAAHVVTRRLEANLPGILLLGQRFNSNDPIETQVRRPEPVNENETALV